MKKFLIFLSLSALFIGCHKKEACNCNKNCESKHHSMGCDENADKDECHSMRHDEAHNSQNSLDYEGVYTGTTPCADCEGIETVLTLNHNSTYTLTLKYLGKGNTFTSHGSFHWSKDGSSITLDKDKSLYKVGERKLIQLDTEGKEITGKLASKYILTKK